MSAGQAFASIRSSSAVEVTSAVRWREGRLVVRSPEQLRLHRALEEINWTGELDEFNNAVRLPNLSVTRPILATTNGTILAGFGRWRSAVFNGQHEIYCIEYPIAEDESLQFILSHHQTRCGWNAFLMKVSESII